MNRFATLCSITAMALTMTACNQTPDTHDADVKAIQDNETQWNQDFAAKDPEKLVAHYADNAVVIVPGAAPSSGKDAIRAFVKEMIADPALALHFHSTKVEVAKSSDVAYSAGVYTLDFTDPQTKQVVHDHGNYVTTYSKQPDGSWKAVVDINTSEVPPTPPPMSHT